jgi:hypothetical protein
MKKSIIILILALAATLVVGFRVAMQSRHQYVERRICYAPIGAPQCSDLKQFIDTFIQGSKALSPNRKIVFLGTLYTVGTIPAEWNIEINEHLGDATSPLDVLRFRPWTWNRTSGQFGTFTSKTIEVNDSIAILKVVGGIDSVQSIIELRRRW